MQYYRLLLSLASGAVGVQSDFPCQCCGTGRHSRTQHPIADFYLAAVAQAIFEGAMVIVTKKMDFGLNSYVSISKLRYFVLFMYDSTSY